MLDNQSDSLCDQILMAHNSFREQHDAMPLVLNEELCEQAQCWANKLAKQGHITYCEMPDNHLLLSLSNAVQVKIFDGGHALLAEQLCRIEATAVLCIEGIESLPENRSKVFDDVGIGENITFFPLHISGDQIVGHWYGEHVKYDYESPGWQAGTNFFTQVVWKATKEIGIGRSVLADCWMMMGLPESEENASPLGQVIVVFYQPAGNNNRCGQFAANVCRPNGK